jgi:hypothetical protein
MRSDGLAEPILASSQASRLRPSLGGTVSF